MKTIKVYFGIILTVSYIGMIWNLLVNSAFLSYILTGIGICIVGSIFIVGLEIIRAINKRGG